MLKRHKSIGVFVVYNDTGSSMPISSSKSSDLAIVTTLPWLFRIISIPSKFCYFRPPDHQS
jgi:hypothetical protein